MNPFGSCSRQNAYPGYYQSGYPQASVNSPSATATAIGPFDQQQNFPENSATQEVIIEGKNIEEVRKKASEMQKHMQSQGQGLQAIKVVAKLVFVNIRDVPQCPLCHIRARHIDPDKGLQPLCSKDCYWIFDVNVAKCLTCHTQPRVFKRGKWQFYCTPGCANRQQLSSSNPSSISPPVQMGSIDLGSASASASVESDMRTKESPQRIVSEKPDILQFGDISINFNGQIECEQPQDMHTIQAEIGEMVRRIYNGWFRRFKSRISLSTIQNKALSSDTTFSVLYGAFPAHPTTKVEKKTFHEKCDKQGATLFLVSLEDGSVFGGFTSKDWQSEGGYVNDAYAFLYRLNKPISDKDESMTIFNPILGHMARAVFHSDLTGPSWGTGPDLSITLDGPEFLGKSCSNLGSSYESKGTNLADTKGPWNVKHIVMLKVNCPYY